MLYCWVNTGHSLLLPGYSDSRTLSDREDTKKGESKSSTLFHELTGRIPC